MVEDVVSSGLASTTGVRGDVEEPVARRPAGHDDGADGAAAPSIPGVRGGGGGERRVP
jgi:hypothetical protein